MILLQISACVYLFVKARDLFYWFKKQRPLLKVSRFTNRVLMYPGSFSFGKMYSGVEIIWSFGPWPSKIKGSMILFKRGNGPILEWDRLTKAFEPTKVVFKKTPKFK